MTGWELHVGDAQILVSFTNGGLHVRLGGVLKLEDNQ
jgi:hypothetical protein